MWFCCLLALLVASSGASPGTFRVAHLDDGDVFDNYEGSEDFCTTAGAICEEEFPEISQTPQSGECFESGISHRINGSCQACRCNNSYLDASTLKCDPTNYRGE